MATTRFFAAGIDEIRVMEFVFAETDCEVWQSYSTYDQALRRFASVADLERSVGLGRNRERQDRRLALCLWSPSLGARLTATRYDLKVKGATFREKADGWGLIHVQFGGSDATTVEESCVTANSQRRAEAWSHAYTALDPPSAWDRTADTTNRLPPQEAARRHRLSRSSRPSRGSRRPWRLPSNGPALPALLTVR